MLSPSDFNNAVPQFTNGDYASNPINPRYIAEPDAENYNRGTEPLQTLPAQWWNWFLNKFTSRFNKVNIYVKNIFNELTQLLSIVSVTPSGTEGSPTVGQLKDMFENKYPSYLALLMYPVGSIYWTGKAPNDGGDPNILFGGTWVQIKDRFILAAGYEYANGATGGEATVTLLASQIPSHKHTGTTDNGGVNHTHYMQHQHYWGAYTGGITANHKHDMSHTHGGYTSTEGDHTHTTYDYGRGTNATSGGEKANKKGDSAYESGYTSTNGAHAHTIATNSMSTTTTGLVSSDHLHFVEGWTTTARYTGDLGTDRDNTDAASAYLHAHSFTTGATGENGAHNNMPPYIVKYCWQRTA